MEKIVLHAYALKAANQILLLKPQHDFLADVLIKF